MWALVPGLVACGGSDPASQLQKAASWAATTRELAVERRVGAIGQAYTTDLLDAGRQEVQKIAQSLDPSTLPDSVRARAPLAVAQLDTIMARVAEAVRKGDDVGITTAAASADTLGSVLRTLHAQAGGQ